MSWANVQSVTAARIGSTVVLTLNGVTASNLLTVQCSYFRNATLSTTPPAISDSNGSMLPASVPNAVTLSVGASDSEGTAIWYEKNAASGTHTVTITLDSNASSDGHATLTEWSGGTGTLDGVSSSLSQSGGQSRTSGTTAPLANNGDLSLVAMFITSVAGVANAAITDPPAGYTSQYVQQNTATDIGVEFAYQVLSSVAAQTVTWTWTDVSTVASGGVIATFSISAGVPPILMGQACL